MADTNPSKVVTGIVRFSYTHIWEPASIDEDAKKAFSTNIIIPKSDKDTIKAIKKAIDAAAEAGKAKLGGKIPTNLKTPLRDGDEERPDDETYQDAYFINAKTYSRPGVVDRNAKPILDQEEFYAGCYGRASITFYAFNTSGNKGIAAGLNNVMKTKDGERLGGRVSAEQDFADFLSDDDDLI